MSAATCAYCGRHWPVPSLARTCEARHNAAPSDPTAIIADTPQNDEGSTAR